MKNQNRNNKGFLLLEVLISIIIIAATLIVINRAFSSSLRAVEMAGDYLTAACILEDKIFDLQVSEIQPGGGLRDVRLTDTVKIGQREYFFLIDISPLRLDKDEEEDGADLKLKEAVLSLNWGEADADSVRFKVYTYVWEEQD